MYVLVIFCYNFDTSTGYDTDNDGRLERLVCRVARYKQESAKYRKIVAVVWSFLVLEWILDVSGGRFETFP